MWVFLLYQAQQAKRKQEGIFKAGETRISTRNFDTKNCASMLKRSLTSTTELVENCDRYKFIVYSQLNQYICACLKLLRKQRDAGQSVISTEMIKSEIVCMLMKMVQSRKVKYSRSTYKENAASSITPYHLVGEIQQIKEALWVIRNKCKEYSLAGLRDRMCFLMTKCGTICGKSFFWCE